MKIVDLETFRAMPTGTIASKYEPCVFDDLFAKGDTLQHDFCLEYLTNEIDAISTEDMTDKLFAAQESGISVPMSFDEIMRDGCFEDKQLFAVWEREDVERLMSKLATCLESYI